MPPSFMLTLWGNDEAFIQKYLVDTPGYYTTGDAGVIDERGYLQIMTRVDDVINTCGHRISTGHLEEVINEHSDVVESAVVGAGAGAVESAENESNIPVVAPNVLGKDVAPVVLKASPNTTGAALNKESAPVVSASVQGAPSVNKNAADNQLLPSIKEIIDLLTQIKDLKGLTPAIPEDITLKIDKLIDKNKNACNRNNPV